MLIQINSFEKFSHITFECNVRLTASPGTLRTRLAASASKHRAYYQLQRTGARAGSAFQKQAQHFRGVRQVISGCDRLCLVELGLALFSY